MRLFRYIGEFFLFRWLFGKIQYTDNNDSPTSKTSDSRALSSNFYDTIKYDLGSQSFNGFHEEQDDYDMMDDF